MTTTELAPFAGAERYDDGAQWIEQTRARVLGMARTAFAGEQSGERRGQKGTLVVGAVIAAFVLMTAVDAMRGAGSLDADAPAARVAVKAQATAEQGDIANPLPQPYTAEGLLGGEKYSLTGHVVDADANAAVAGYNMFNEEAPAGFKYVVVELTMTGIDPDGVEPLLANFDLSLATPEGNRYDTEFISFADGMADMTDGPTLYPGSSFTGHTAYIVPEGADSFLLYDNGNYVML